MNRGRNQQTREQSRSSSTASQDRFKQPPKANETVSKKPEAEKKTESSVKESRSVTKAGEEVSEEQMRKSNVNLAGQDVDRLLDMLYHRGRKCYVCKFCRIICNKPTSMRQHLYGKKHCLNVAEKRGETLKIDEEPKEEEKNPEPAPESPKEEESKVEEAVTTPDEDLVKYFCDTKKTAMKQLPHL